MYSGDEYYGDEITSPIERPQPVRKQRTEPRPIESMEEQVNTLRAQLATAHEAIGAARMALIGVEAMRSWLQSFYNDVLNTTPEYIERCGDWNAVQYMMQDCEGIANQVTDAIAQLEKAVK